MRILQSFLNIWLTILGLFVGSPPSFGGGGILICLWTWILTVTPRLNVHRLVMKCLVICSWSGLILNRLRTLFIYFTLMPTSLLGPPAHLVCTCHVWSLRIFLGDVRVRTSFLEYAQKIVEFGWFLIGAYGRAVALTGGCHFPCCVIKPIFLQSSMQFVLLFGTHQALIVLENVGRT